MEPVGGSAAWSLPTGVDSAGVEVLPGEFSILPPPPPERGGLAVPAWRGGRRGEALLEGGPGGEPRAREAWCPGPKTLLGNHKHLLTYFKSEENLTVQPGLYSTLHPHSHFFLPTEEGAPEGRTLSSLAAGNSSRNRRPRPRPGRGAAP